MQDGPARDDDATLAQALGIKANPLERVFRRFSNFAISFSTISVLTGAVLLYGYGLKFAGPVVNTVGWPLASALTLCVAASMAEIASVYPTAGGLYYWAFRLGDARWAWFTGWLNMVGQVTMTAGVNIAAAMYLIGAVTQGLRISTVPLLGCAPTDWYFQVGVMTLLTIPQVLINVYSVRLVRALNDLSVFWHVGGVLLIVVLLLALGAHRNGAGFLFSTATPVSPLEASSADLGQGMHAPALVVGEHAFPSPLFALVPGLRALYECAPFSLVFLLALLQAQWTYTSYDASAHLAEETVNAGRNSALGIFQSVAVSAVAGYALLLVLTRAIPGGDVAATARHPYPVLYIVGENLRAYPRLADLVAVVIGGAMWLCGLASITAMSRMWYAVARDDGIPLVSARLKRVSPRHRTPVEAIVLTSGLSVALCLAAAAFSVITSVSTIALYLAYAAPIYLNLRNKLRERHEYTTAMTATWHLGGWGVWLNALALAWVGVMTVVFFLPPNELVLWALLGLLATLAVYWEASAKRTFKGPPHPA
jgi:amino acid transporter